MGQKSVIYDSEYIIYITTKYKLKKLKKLHTKLIPNSINYRPKKGNYNKQNLLQ